MDNPKLPKIRSMLVWPGLVARAESKTVVSSPGVGVSRVVPLHA